MPFPHKRVLAAGAVCTVVLAASAGAVHYTSSRAFCLSCHEMRVHQQELALSSHARDAEGREITCSQCHIPSGNVVRMLAAKSWMGARDLWAHANGEGEDLDRAAMQTIARRFTDDANCLACHEDLTKNARRDGPVSREGQLAHDNYLGRNGQSRSGCVGCHQNLAHLPEFDERIPRNSQFAAKLKESRSCFNPQSPTDSATDG